jgi:hypothetical protein
MNAQELIDTARTLVAGDKGLLAMDESNPTCNRPFLVGAKTNIHPLLLFFTVIGGIQAFGMIGVIAGPLIGTLCLTLIEIYVREGKRKP